MGTKKTIGGQRLGSGKKMQVELHNYGRSTHDLGYIWRSSMAPGTLVPYMSILGLPNDSFDIELNTDVKTLPTVGPLFGSFKQQLDVFMCPIRLYQGLLHNNKLGIGNNMSQVKLPQLEIQSKNLDFNSETPLEFQQINQSSLLAYLGIRGVGHNPQTINTLRRYNAIPYLGYWDIYKNYYANKQEEIGAVVHTLGYDVLNWLALDEMDGSEIVNSYNPNTISYPFALTDSLEWRIKVPKGKLGDEYIDNILLDIGGVGEVSIPTFAINYTINLTNPDYDSVTFTCGNLTLNAISLINDRESVDDAIQVQTFPLENIDTMREDILSQTKNVGPFIINKESIAPYNYPLVLDDNGYPIAARSQEGLGIKTYQSDMFNNWISTEWIDGESGINSITAISTEGGSFTLDTLNLSKKVYDMLNRIAISGGSYNDWVEAVYDAQPWNSAESPVYMGGLSKEVVFNEVISTAQVGEDNPLGTLAGRGSLAKKHKGGRISIKVTEPCFIIGIVSLTPRVDYSQGNDWTVNLKTMDDFHKPALDEIGFQELITEQLAFWDTINQDNNQQIMHSVGKQPAWINYMSAVNKCYGNFADPRKEMYMTLNRRYEAGNDKRIKDLTTYIDPVKYNYMFANTALDAQNFWVQIAVDITARRKMSAKIMPNL
nr:MAG: major capsid protein [Microvirus sp.]